MKYLELISTKLIKSKWFLNLQQKIRIFELDDLVDIFYSVFEKIESGVQNSVFKTNVLSDGLFIGWNKIKPQQENVFVV